MWPRHMGYRTRGPGTGPRQHHQELRVGGARRSAGDTGAGVSLRAEPGHVGASRYHRRLPGLRADRRLRGPGQSTRRRARGLAEYLREFFEKLPLARTAPTVSRFSSVARPPPSPPSPSTPGFATRLLWRGCSTRFRIAIVGEAGHQSAGHVDVSLPPSNAPTTERRPRPSRGSVKSYPTGRGAGAVMEETWISYSEDGVLGGARK